MDNEINEKLCFQDAFGWLGTGFSVVTFWIHSDENSCCVINTVYVV
jgi:hypothetical protein